MDADLPCNFCFAQSLFEESRGLHTALFQLDTINFDTGRISHAGQYTR
jgi:hypothetical protein